MAIQSAAYPVTYSVDTPTSLSRWLWLVKWLLVFPHLFVLMLLGIVSWFTLLATWFAIVITGKRPRGLWDFHLGIQRWSVRVSGYSGHLTDRYPPFSMEQEAGYPVRLDAEYTENASRLTTFFRYFLVIPHGFVLFFVNWVASFVWFAFIVVVIVTGKPHEGLFNFLVGVNRWQARATLYYLLLTDEYPPFSMD